MLYKEAMWKYYIYLKIKVFKFSVKNIIKGCQLPHLQSQAVPQHISATRKASFIKFGVGFWKSELVFIKGYPTTLLSEVSVRRGKNCLEFSIA